jgi:SAM-dependent methyltransferase
LYTRLPAGAEPDVIAGVVPAGASILELGAGAGRITHPMVERGYRVVAVDDSREMLERIRGARTVHSSIEELSLDERFDTVLLGSFLVNTSEPAARAEMLRCCRRHVASGGRVLIQRQGENWFNDRRASQTWESRGVRTWIASVERVAPDVCAVRIEYEIDGNRWTHSFHAQDVPDLALEQLLHEAGLRIVRYLTDDHSWVEAAARDDEQAAR